MEEAVSLQDAGFLVEAGGQGLRIACWAAATGSGWLAPGEPKRARKSSVDIASP